MSQAERTPKTAPRAGAKAKPLFDRETVNEIKSDLARGLEYRAAPRAKARAARRRG